MIILIFAASCVFHLANAGCELSTHCWQTGCTIDVVVSPWQPDAIVELKLDDGMTILNPWNADKAGGSGGLQKLKLKSYSTTHFGFNTDGAGDVEVVSCGSEGGGGGQKGKSSSSEEVPTEPPPQTEPPVQTQPPPPTEPPVGTGSGESTTEAGSGDTTPNEVETTEAGSGEEPVEGEFFEGELTSYGDGFGGGNCGFENDLPSKVTENFMFAALNNDQWEDGQNCGRCARVRCTDDRCKGNGVDYIDVYISNRCPECHKGHLDLSDTAFKTLTGSHPSRYQGGFSWVDCVDTGFVKGNGKLFLKEGSSDYWYAIQPRNFRQKIASVSIEGSDGKVIDLLKPGEHSISTYYYHETAPFAKPIKVIIEAVDGQKEVIEMEGLWPAGTELDTGVQFKP